MLILKLAETKIESKTISNLKAIKNSICLDEIDYTQAKKMVDKIICGTPISKHFEPNVDEIINVHNKTNEKLKTISKEIELIESISQKKHQDTR